jgi:hypothetical protein
MRPEILPVLYDHFDNMTILNDYYFDWESVKSKGNGSLALKKATVSAKAKSNISFGNAEELQAVSGGRSLVQVPMFVSANVPYKISATTLENHDPEAELIRSKLLSDLRNGFRFVTGEMCSAGVQYIFNMQETDSEVSNGDMVLHVKVQFDLQYFE